MIKPWDIIGWMILAAIAIAIFCWAAIGVMHVIYLAATKIAAFADRNQKLEVGQVWKTHDREIRIKSASAYGARQGFVDGRGDYWTQDQFDNLRKRKTVWLDRRNKK